MVNLNILRNFIRNIELEQSRRDDLESIGYMLLYFLKGGLPWQNVKANTKKEKYDMIKEIKRNFEMDEFCNGFPGFFHHFSLKKH